MRFILLFVFMFGLIFSFSQPISRYNSALHSGNIKSDPVKKTLQRLSTAEICGNNIDDDNNELIDEKDFSCYYSVSDTAGCLPSKIIWASSNYQLYWVDPETNIEKLIGTMGNFIMDDITWASNGKLYAIERIYAGLYEVDPYTAAVQFVSFLQGYYASNAMTSDGSGNLYLAAVKPSGQRDVIKFNLSTFQVTVIADLSAKNLFSAGDLTFLNGDLFLTCDESKVAKINVTNGSVQVFTMINPPTTAAFGLITLGDGYLYLCNIDKIYRFDPTTMVVDSTAYYSFQSENIYMLGLSNYTEHCNAPGCKAKVGVNVLSSQPYCSTPGVLIHGNGKGIVGKSSYTWTLPDGTSFTGDTLKATKKGMYKLRYHTDPDTCGVNDSIFVDVIMQPKSNLGNDTIVCVGSSLKLAPLDITDITSYLWQDGNTQSSYTTTLPGVYSIVASNVCGFSKDTITVQPATLPEVDIGSDTIICPGSEVVFYNHRVKQPWDHYLWSGLVTTDSITVASEGIFSLQSSNACGVSSDSITVSFKDSCSCFPFYPEIELGNDVELCSYDMFVVKNSLHKNGFHYMWQDGFTGENYTAKTTGIYWVDVTTYCGVIKDSIMITPKIQGCERRVFIPSAFTPNNDGKNDLFKPYVVGNLKSFELIIYNRWGEMVFKTNDPVKGWRGSYSGKTQNTGVFVWFCTYNFEGESIKAEKGTVTLIR